MVYIIAKIDIYIVTLEYKLTFLIPKKIDFFYKKEKEKNLTCKLSKSELC